MTQQIKNTMATEVFTLSRPLARLGMVALLAIGVASCGGDSNDDDNGGGGGESNFTDHAALIANSANIMGAGFAQLATSTTALQTSINAYCADAASIADAANRTAAQDAFKTAMNDVQHSVMHKIGPAEDAINGIRIVYSWPLTSSCRVDTKLSEGLVAGGEVLPPGNPINRRGMDALEYLLFVDSAAMHSCDPTTAGADLVAFDALSAEAKQARRCGYMKHTIVDVVAVADTLKTAWASPVSAITGTNSDPLVTLNDITDAMYYLADEGKEDKLDQPMGGGRTQTTPSCGLGVPCPADVESPNAKLSFDNLRANTLAFQNLYFGGASADKANNVGFDDWMEAVDGNRVAADKMGSDIEAVLAGLDSLQNDTNCATLYHSITHCSTQLQTFFDGPFQDVTQGFRDNVLPNLGLRRPQGSLADVD